MTESVALMKTRSALLMMKILPRSCSDVLKTSCSVLLRLQCSVSLRLFRSFCPAMWKRFCSSLRMMALRLMSDSRMIYRLTMKFSSKPKNLRMNYSSQTTKTVLALTKTVLQTMKTALLLTKIVSQTMRTVFQKRTSASRTMKTVFRMMKMSMYGGSGHIRLSGMPPAR